MPAMSPQNYLPDEGSRPPSRAQVVIHPSRTWIPPDVRTNSPEPEGSSGERDSAPVEFISLPLTTPKDTGKAIRAASQRRTSTGQFINLTKSSGLARKKRRTSHADASYIILPTADVRKSNQAANQSRDRTGKFLQRSQSVGENDSRELLDTPHHAGRDASTPQLPVRGETETLQGYLSRKAALQTRDGTGKFSSTKRKPSPSPEAEEVQEDQELEVEDVDSRGRSTSRPPSRSETHDLHKFLSLKASSQPRDGTGKFLSSSKKSAPRVEEQELSSDTLKTTHQPRTITVKFGIGEIPKRGNNPQESYEALANEKAVDTPPQDPRGSQLSLQGVKNALHPRQSTGKIGNATKSRPTPVFSDESGSSPIDPHGRRSARARDNIATYNIKALADASLYGSRKYQKTADDHESRRQTISNINQANPPTLWFNAANAGLPPRHSTGKFAGTPKSNSFPQSGERLVMSSDDHGYRDLSRKSDSELRPPPILPPCKQILPQPTKTHNVSQSNGASHIPLDNDPFYAPDLPSPSTSLGAVPLATDQQNVSGVRQEISQVKPATAKSIFKRAFDTLLGQALRSNKTRPTTEAVVPPPILPPVKSLTQSTSQAISLEDGSSEARDIPKRNTKKKKTPLVSPFFTPINSPTKGSKTSGSQPDGLGLPPRGTPKTPRTPGGTVSCIPFPPLSSPTFGLIQERLAHQPFSLLIAVTFLIKTRGSVAIPVFSQLIAKYPTPEALASADRDDIVQIIHHLGLQNQRATTYQTYAHIWIASPAEKGKRYAVPGYPTKKSGRGIKKDEILDDDDERDAWEIGHMTQGPYILDSWRIFCRDILRGVAEGWNGEGSTEGFQPEWMRVIPQDKELRAYLRWMWLKEGFEWDPFTGEKEVASQELTRAAMKGNIAWDEKGGMRIVLDSEEPNKQDVAMTGMD